jgi:hypothetical protein
MKKDELFPNSPASPVAKKEDPAAFVAAAKASDTTKPKKEDAVVAPKKEDPAAFVAAAKASEAKPEAPSGPVNLSPEETEIRDWINVVLKDKVFLDTVETKNALQDGQILCKVANTLRKDNKPIKINAGKFAASHTENVNNYLKTALEVFKIPNSNSFKAEDLTKGANMEKVMKHLQVLKKLFEGKV